MPIYKTLIKGLLLPPNGVPFVFLYNPAEINDVKSANWSNTEVLYADGTRTQFISGGTRKISFNLIVDHRLLQRIPILPIFSAFGVVEGYIQWLRTLQKAKPPTEVDGTNKPPPILTMVFGSWWFQGVIEGTDITRKRFSPVLGLLEAEVKVNMIEVQDFTTELINETL